MVKQKQESRTVDFFRKKIEKRKDYSLSSFINFS